MKSVDSKIPSVSGQTEKPVRQNFPTVLSGLVLAVCVSQGAFAGTTAPTQGIASSAGTVATTAPTSAPTSSAPAASDITNREMAQAIINYDAEARAKDRAAQAELMYAPPPLLSVSLMRGAGASKATSLVGQNNAVMVQRLLGGAMNGSPMPLSYTEGLSSVVPSSYDLSTHYTLFCMVQEIGPILASNCASQGGMQGTDLNAANLLSAARLDDTNPLGLVAADNLIRNLTEFNFTPMIGLTGGNVSDLPGPRLEELRRRLNQVAQSSVAMYSFSNMLSARLPQQFAPFVSGYQAQGTPPAKLDKSFMEVLQDESSRRFTDPNWAAQMLQAPDSALLRELAQMESFRLYMDFARYQQMERVEALLATLLSTQLSALRAVPFQPQQPVNGTMPQPSPLQPQ